MQRISHPLFIMILTLVSNATYAADSYRFLHVTIDTPWMIFLFLLVIVLFPFVLMAILYWYFTIKKHQEERAKQATQVEPD